MLFVLCFCLKLFLLYLAANIWELTCGHDSAIPVTIVWTVIILCCYKTLIRYGGGALGGQKSQRDELHQRGSLMHFRQVPLMECTAVYCEAQAKGLTFWVTVQLQSARKPNEPAALMSVSKNKDVIVKHTTQLMSGWWSKKKISFFPNVLQQSL